MSLTSDGFLAVEFDGRSFSGDARSAHFTPALAGVGSANLARIHFDGQDGQDTLVIGDLHVDGGLSVHADELVSVEGEVRAGRAIDWTARSVLLTGGLQATAVSIDATNVIQAGPIQASESVVVRCTQQYTATATGTMEATRIEVQASDRLFSSGSYQADSGSIDLLAADVVLIGATVNASGEDGGGRVRIGGDYQGSNPEVLNARTTTVSSSTVIRADAVKRGVGGRVIVWADDTTEFAGLVTAQGGNGGFIEVSGRGELMFAGRADAGVGGVLLLDPKNLIISETGDAVPSRELMAPDMGGEFGKHVVALSTGNVVVTSPSNRTLGQSGGAVYVFNGASGTLISALYGLINGNVGAGGIIALANGNFVVRSPEWNNDCGAVTWGSGTTGISGVVSSANSLVGSSRNDKVGGSSIGGNTGGVFTLSNGNYVVRSPSWYSNRGAVTWGSGTYGISGVVSATNSLVGSATNDMVGADTTAVWEVGVSNYIVRSPNWNASRGAVTWGNGTAGISGTISAANSLVGSTAGDRVGTNTIPAILAGGNYVVTSPSWDSGTVVDAGAVTWGSGNSGISGTISAANSLTGSVANDRVGNGGVTVLSNGNYVVSSPNWDNGAIVDAGAATWGSGTAWITGTISASNSYVGATASDQVGNGGVVALTNGNFVVRSTSWSSARGAATWGNGSVGISGTISATNSLVGSTAGDQVGHGVTALTHGNYVVTSPWWRNGTVVNAGAATWGSGTSGVTGAVSVENSLVGSTAQDTVGYGGVAVLTTGGYVVRSPYWNGWGFNRNGAATWGSSTAGVIGIVSPANSLVSDGPGGENLTVTALANGNFAVAFPGWNSGRGAVAWGSGSAGLSGIVSAPNSLIGSTPDDKVGEYGVAELANGNYVVRSPSWDHGFAVDAGAATWGSGISGITGIVSTANSLVGSRSNERVGATVNTLPNGNYIVRTPNWNYSSVVVASGAVTWGSGISGVTGIISEANSLVSTWANDQIGTYCVILPDNNYVVVGPVWAVRGSVTWGSGTSGIAGEISAQNSLVDRYYSPQMGSVVADTINGTFLVSFPNEGGGHVTIGIPHAENAYARGQGGSFALHPSSLLATLSTGTSLVLQASNDIVVRSPLLINNPDGRGGSLTMQAGRSIRLEASIVTDGGDLTLIANDLLISGVIDADREPGLAEIHISHGSEIDVGGGSVTVEMRTGAGKTHASSGDVTLEGIRAGSLTVLSAGSDVIASNLSVSGPVTLTSAGVVDLDNVTIYGTVRVVSFGDVSLVTAGAIDLGASTVGGNLTLFAGSMVTDSGNLAVTGTTDITAGGSVLLDRAGNDFGGSVSVTSGNHVTLVDVNALSLGSSVIAGNLKVTTAGPLTQSGPVSVTGSTHLTSGANPIALADPANDFDGDVTFATTENVHLADANTLRLGSTLVVGGQTVTLDAAVPVQLGGDTAVASTGRLAAPNGLTLASGATLSGTGTIDVGAGIAGLHLLSGSTLSAGASPGTLIIDGDLELDGGSTLAVELQGTASGLFDQLDVRGGVDLGGATLVGSFGGGYTPAVGNAFPIVVNDGTDAVVGRFAQDSRLSIDGILLAIDYLTGSGSNDVTVTVANLGDIAPTLAAHGDIFGVAEDSDPTTLYVLGNDVGSGLTITEVSSPVLGTVSIVPGGTAVRYTPPANFAGYDTFTYTVTDAALNTATATVIVAVTPVNDAPVVSAPGPMTFLANKDQAVAGISVADVDVNQGSGTIQVTLAVSGGTLTLRSPAGLAFTTGDGRADATMTFTGTLAGVNAALATLVYRAPLDSVAPAVLTVTANDLGNSGSGGPKSATRTVALDPAQATWSRHADPTLVGKQSLIVQGTSGADSILVQPVGTSLTTYLVTINGGVPATVTGVTGRIQVFGLDGNDALQLGAVKIATWLNGGGGNDSLVGGAGNDKLTGGPGDDRFDGGAGIDRLVESGDSAVITLVQGTATTNGSLTGLGTDVLVKNTVEEADLSGGEGNNTIDASAFTGKTWLSGGGGNDTLRAGKGNSILLGGTGDDNLFGNLGRDLLIGGLGTDSLNGGAGDDLLIGGSTTHDSNRVALDALMMEWANATIAYALRIKHLMGTAPGGLNGLYRLNLTTVTHDGLTNTLTGGAGLDWFLVKQALDAITDVNLGGVETKTLLN